jgi:dipeptidyl aminopeptidase/acylaminoacyl peptidase
MSTSKGLRFIVLVAGLCACALGAAAEPPLRSDAFARFLADRPHGFARVALSPDGARACTVVLRADGTTAVEVFDWASGSRATVLTASPAEDDLAWCSWSSVSRLIVRIAARTSTRAHGELIAVNADGTLRKKLGALDLLSFAPDQPELVTVTTGRRLGVMNTFTGAAQFTWPAGADFPLHGFIVDGDGFLRVVATPDSRWHMRTQADSRWRFVEDPAAGAWYAFPRVAPLSPVALDASGRVVYYAAKEGRLALFALDNDGSSTPLFSHPTQDVVDVVTFGKDRRAVAANYYDGQWSTDYFDARVKEVRASAASKLPGLVIDVLDEDWNRRFYLLRGRAEHGWGDYYRYDTANDTLAPLPLASPLKERGTGRRLSYVASDGRPIPSYLFEPAESTRGAAVILPQLPPIGAGNYEPWDQEFMARYLAAAGYVVLEPAVRGALGYGMPDDTPHLYFVARSAADIADAADYLVQEGLADAHKICVVGAGFGGTAALVAAFEHPETFGCVTALGAPLDLERMYNAQPRDVRTTRFADDVGALGALSPSKRVADLRVPVQLVHGRPNEFCAIEETQALDATLTKLQHPVDFVEYPNAVDDLSRPAIRADFLIRVTEFIDAHTK